LKGLLADTGPLYALADPADQFHRRAQEELARLYEDGYRPIAAWSTLAEAHNLVLRRLGFDRAREWLGELTAGIDLMNPVEEDYLKAVHLLKLYPDQDITLCDGVLAVLSSQFELPVWTYDHHFDVMQAQVWR
jgi:predicted nucleic acid-binding protein